MNLFSKSSKMRENDVSTLAARQNVIRTKFQKAFTKRIECEEDMNLAMKPLTAIPMSSPPLPPPSPPPPPPTASITAELKSKNKDFPRCALSRKPLDPNALCTSLRMLFSTSLRGNDMNRIHRINDVLDKLRELKIIL